MSVDPRGYETHLEQQFAETSDSQPSGAADYRATSFRSRPLLEVRRRTLEDGRRSLSLTFPVLVTNPGCPIENLRWSTVHPVVATSRAFTIGRGGDSDLVIEDGTVSRRHASLARQGETWSISDDGSTNGTYLDAERVAPGKPQPIRAALAILRFGLRARLALMDEVTFLDYLESLPTPPSAFEETRSDLKAKSIRGDDYRALKILDRVRAEGTFASRWRVRLVGNLSHAVESWSDLVAFVREHADSITAIDAFTALGARLAVYRAATIAKSPADELSA
jgi:hypothetical protein